jgi:hypothetical protein
VSRIYTYQDIYNIVNANGDLAPSTFTTTFTGTLTIDLLAYQQEVLKLNFKEFKDTALQSDVTTTNVIPTIEDLLGITRDGVNQYKPDGDGGSAFLAGDRVIINAKKDYAMLFGKKGVAIASPNQVNIDTGKSITLFGHEENGVFLGLPNRGKATQPPVSQKLLGKTKGDPTPDQLYEPLVLGFKLANLIEDFLVTLSNAEMASAISIAKWQPSTQGEFALLANRIPEILSTYAYIDGISHEEIDTETLDKLKAAQLKAKNFIPPTSLSGSVEGTFAQPIPGTVGASGSAGLQGSLFIVGDSIASGIAGRVGKPNEKKVDARGISQVGANAQIILGFLKELQASLTGNTVILSTGLTNGPTLTNVVKQQLDLLKSVNAKVFIVGVADPDPSAVGGLAAKNKDLQAFATQYGATYLGSFVSTDKYGHPNYQNYKDAKIKPLGLSV